MTPTPDDPARVCLPSCAPIGMPVHSPVNTCSAPRGPQHPCGPVRLQGTSAPGSLVCGQNQSRAWERPALGRPDGWPIRQRAGAGDRPPRTAALRTGSHRHRGCRNGAQDGSWLVRVWATAGPSWEAMPGPPADPSIFPSYRSPLLSAMGPCDPGSNSLPLQRRPPTAPPCMGSPPGGGKMMGAACLRTGARMSRALVSPGGQSGPRVLSRPWGRAGGVAVELLVPPVVLSPRPSRPRAAQGPGSAGRRSHGDTGRLPGPLGASDLLLPAGAQLLRDPHQGGAPPAASRGAGA